MAEGTESLTDSCSSGASAPMLEQDAECTTFRTGSMESLTDETETNGQLRRRITSGCLSCRRRRKMCDEERPICNQCRRFNLSCDLEFRPIDMVSDRIKDGPKVIAPKQPGHSTNNNAIGSIANPIFIEENPGSPSYLMDAPKATMAHLTTRMCFERRPNSTPYPTLHQGTQLPLETSPQKANMLSGQAYDSTDPQLVQDRERCRRVLWRLNNTFGEPDRLNAMRQLVRFLGSDTQIDTPFLCEYGYNISIGDEVYVGPNCTIVDPSRVVIGSRCFIGPNVNIFGKKFSFNPRDQRGCKKGAYGMSVGIEDDVCIEGNVTIFPGVKIGRGSKIAAGSLVTKSIPPFSFAGGNPASVMEYV